MSTPSFEHLTPVVVGYCGVNGRHKPHQGVRKTVPWSCDGSKITLYYGEPEIGLREVIFDNLSDEVVDKATRAYFDAWDVERKFDFLNPKSNVVQVNMAKPMMKKALQAVVADLFEAQLEAQ